MDTLNLDRFIEDRINNSDIQFNDKKKEKMKIKFKELFMKDLELGREADNATTKREENKINKKRTKNYSSLREMILTTNSTRDLIDIEWGSKPFSLARRVYDSMVAEYYKDEKENSKEDQKAKFMDGIDQRNNPNVTGKVNLNNVHDNSNRSNNIDNIDKSTDEMQL